jgi:hypothetical protein
VQRAFISHSWGDKPFARRIARRLAHRGVPVWIDEAEMQLGDRLSERLEQEIRACSHLLVVLTPAAAVSRWIGLEVEVARSAEPPIPVVPLLAEPGVESRLLEESIGADVTDPLAFEARMDAIARAILGRQVLDCDRDRNRLLSDLEAIGGETPALRTLIVQLRDEGRLTQAQLDAWVVTEDLRHPTETALLALHELADARAARYVISLVAARFYRRLGVGFPVLIRQLRGELPGSDHVETMFAHLGGRVEREQDFAGAFRLFQEAPRPPDFAFSGFVNANFDRFDAAEREQCVALMTTPDRGPRGGAIDAAFNLFTRMPDSAALRTLWWFWVQDYKFGGREGVEDALGPHVFFNHMSDAVRAGSVQFDPIMAHFEDCFRRLARGSLDSVLEAVHLLTAASDARYVHRDRLGRQLDQALSSAEWMSLRVDSAVTIALRELAEAVCADRSYAAAMDALTDALP